MRNLKTSLPFLIALLFAACVWPQVQELAWKSWIRVQPWAWNATYARDGEPLGKNVVTSAAIHFMDDPSPVQDVTNAFECELHGTFTVVTPGLHTFTSRARGGVRVYMDDRRILDAWHPRSEKYNQNKISQTLNLDPGDYDIRIRYRSTGHPEPRFKVTWQHEDMYAERPFQWPWIRKRKP